MKWHIGQKIVCIENWDEHSSDDNVGKVFTIIDIDDMGGYKLLECKEFRKGHRVNEMHFRPHTKLDKALK